MPNSKLDIFLWLLCISVLTFYLEFCFCRRNKELTQIGPQEEFLFLGLSQKMKKRLQRLCLPWLECFITMAPNIMLKDLKDFKENQFQRTPQFCRTWRSMLMLLLKVVLILTCRMIILSPKTLVLAINSCIFAIIYRLSNCSRSWKFTQRSFKNQFYKWN